MRPVSFYQKASRVIVIWMTTAAIITYFCLLADFLLCCRDGSYYMNNVFSTISEYSAPLGYIFFYLVIGLLFLGFDTPQEFQALEPKAILQISVILLVTILIIAGLYVLQGFFHKKGARLCLGITLALTIVDTVRCVLFAIFSIQDCYIGVSITKDTAMMNATIITGEYILGFLLHLALIFFLIMSMRFTWKEYEHY